MIRITPVPPDGPTGTPITYPTGTPYRFEPMTPELGQEQFIVVGTVPNEHWYSLWSHFAETAVDDPDPDAPQSSVADLLAQIDTHTAAINAAAAAIRGIVLP